MKAYHSTPKQNVASILKEGLRPNSIGIVYLSPDLAHADNRDGQSILEVETGDLKLTAFEDCSDWEVLCWGHIPAENIKIKEIRVKGETVKELFGDMVSKGLVSFENTWLERAIEQKVKDELE